MKIKTKEFGLGATLITLESATGAAMSFTNLGARVVDWTAFGRQIVLGFDSAQEYVAKDLFPGATIGRTAGRIKGGRARIDGREIQLDQNEGEQTLHGGADSFDAKLWRFETFETADRAGVKFYLTSCDGENGYPGKLDVVVTHSFGDDGAWQIDYEAVSTKDTLFNPTGHVYFNLSGDVTKPVDDHELRIASSRMVALADATEVVRGDLIDVTGTALDFRGGRRLSEAFVSGHEQVALVDGIDHPFLLDEVGLEREQARVTADGLSLAVFTDQPAIVIFTANFGATGVIYHGKKEVHHGALTFECQVSPGSEQMPELGTTILPAGARYHATTIYKLSGGAK